METIYSLVTKPINQNVAIIRISGPETFNVIQEMFKDWKPVANSVTYHRMKHEEVFLDEVLLLTFVAPNSFTGEDVVEIQSHGNPTVVSKILSILSDKGLKQSDPGEFLKQSYMNGKIDLAQSEAINTLILSDDENISNISTRNLDGEQSKIINEMIEELGSILSRIQVAVDYPENTDLPEYNRKGIKDSLEKLSRKMENMIQESEKLINVSEGVKISIIGKPNAGKSTLLNYYARKERAIVSDIAGTTRDVVEYPVILNGVKVIFQDTAGIRKSTDDEIEKIGIEKSKEYAQNADIIVLLIDGDHDVKEQLDNFNDVTSKNNTIIAITKGKQHEQLIPIEATKNDVDKLTNKITEYIKNDLTPKGIEENSFLITKNQVSIFKKANNSIKNAISMIDKDHPEDILMFEIENALKEVGKIIGKDIDQDYLTDLFANFCIGK